MALVYAYYDPDGTTTDRARSTLISMTLTVVLISTLVFGAVTKPLLDFMLGSKGTTLPESRCVLTCDCRMRRCIADQCLLSTTSRRPREKEKACIAGGSLTCNDPAEHQKSDMHWPMRQA